MRLYDLLKVICSITTVKVYDLTNNVLYYGLPTNILAHANPKHLGLDVLLVYTELNELRITIREL